MGRPSKYPPELRCEVARLVLSSDRPLSEIHERDVHRRSAEHVFAGLCWLEQGTNRLSPPDTVHCPPGDSARTERSRARQWGSGISMLLASIEMWPPPWISMFNFS